MIVSTRFFGMVCLSVVVIGFIGCKGDNEATVGNASKVNSLYVATNEPSGAIPIGQARSSAKNDESIVLVGHIGGSMKPFVEGLAAFTIVDPKVPYCAAAEGCPTPWDYCCEQNAVKENVAMVKVVDDSGTVVSSDARKLLGVRELSLVVVEGKAQRDDAGNLTLLAKQVYLKK